MKKTAIRTEFIKLSQLLKWVNAAETGAAANQMIAEGLVKVNDEIELRRGKKLRPGDRVEISGIGEFLLTEEGSAGIVSQNADPE